MTNTLSYQLLSNDIPTAEEMQLLDAHSSEVIPPNECCVAPFIQLQYAIGILLIIAGCLGIIVMGVWLGVLWQNPFVGSLGIILSLLDIPAGIYYCYDAYRTKGRPLPHKEPKNKVIFSWAVFVLTIAEVALFGYVFGFGLYHGTGGCYDSCGPAIMIAGISAIAFFPMIIISIMALFLAVKITSAYKATL